MEQYSITRFYTKAAVTFAVFLILANAYTASARPFYSSSAPFLSVEPFLYRATHLGEMFNVSVSISDVDSAARLIGVEFKLQYNDTLLETKEDWFTEGDFLKSFGTTFSKAYVETDTDGRTCVHAFVILLPSGVGGNYSSYPGGDGAIAYVMFNATHREFTAVTCELRLFDTILVDADVNTISHTVRSGSYEMAALRYPTLEVVPKTHVALRNGTTFEVKVNMEGLDRDWRLVGLQFKLRYNTTLLETKPDWIVEGDFLKAHGTTWFHVIVENDYGLVGILILPSQNGSWNGGFSEGNGTLATLTFKTIYQPVGPQTASSCTLMLDDVILMNDKAEEIPHNTRDGEFEIVATSAQVDQYRPIEVQVDVGAIHFKGEIADFYILVTDYGKTITPDGMRAMLYLEGVQYSNLTAGIERVATGLYRVTYTIPVTARPGNYVLLVEAEYAQVQGSAIKSFLVSSTLSNWNAYITSIKDNIATVIIPSIGQMKLDLASVNATLVSIGNNVATIQTSVGTLTTNMANLDAKIVKVDGDIATVQTSLGTLQGDIVKVDDDIATVKTSLGTLQTSLGNLQADVSTVKAKVTDVPTYVQTSTNLLYATTILALIAAIAAVLAVLITRKK
jgi:hypothetical protein